MSPSTHLDQPKTLQSTDDIRPQPRRYHSTSVFYNYSPFASSSAGLSFAGLPDSPSPVTLRTSYFDSPGGFSASRDPTTPSSGVKRGSNLFFPQRHRSFNGGSVSSPLVTSTPLKQQHKAPKQTTGPVTTSTPKTPPLRDSTAEHLNTSVRSTRSTRSTRSALSTRSGDLSDSPLMDPPHSPTPSDRNSAGPTPILVRPGRLPTVGALGRMTGSQPSTPVPQQRRPSKGIMFMPGKGRATTSSYTGGTPSGARPTVAISTAVATASPSTSKSISPTEAHEKAKTNTKHRRASSGASLNSFVSASSSLRASTAPRSKGTKTAAAPASVASDFPVAPHTTGALADIQPTSAVGSFGVEARLATEALENATGGTGRIVPSPVEKIEDDRMSELSSVISSLHVMDELCEVDETVHEIITDGYGNGYIEVVPDKEYTAYVPPYQPRKEHFASMAQHAPQICNDEDRLTLSCGPECCGRDITGKSAMKAIEAPPAKDKGKGKAQDGCDGELIARDERTSLARELARTIISRLPLLSRFATWV
ncbi:hypothetical protein A1Q2_01933 [Trichosporon asahii var. asahii CBS 8904]|uniref:Uncharacterized protein n=1 Tax=Trichosporon asahii var. asahii (strain CBS 8904) TaxID=1220162 RepID=K1VIF8_TRIAC|nr:hypothetical protein A1Q2_01933 [Trichosporon asahii var. asahii CBS 8904]